MPGVRKVRWDDAGEIDWPALGWKHATPPVPLVYVGTPGPSRKAVIHLVHRTSGRCEAVAKVPLCAGARQAIIREAGVLSVLAEEGYPFAPRLLVLDRERGIATQEFIGGTSAGRRWRREWADLLRSLLLPDEHTTMYRHLAIGLERSINRQADCRTEQAPAPEAGPRDVLDRALDHLADTHLLPACWVHGDFAPWNIRTNRHCPPVLIDWEDAERGGLPLQDAFHFFHMQDFLFGRAPTTHSTEMEAFAETLGIAPQQCQRLETAYLFTAYGSCSTQGHQARAAFLLKSLTGAVREHGCPVSAAAPNRKLRLVSSDSPTPRTLRAKLLKRFVAELNRSRIPYCILSGYENNGRKSSDVDIMFCPADMPRVPELLAEIARSSGARLVQSIQHETSGCYFVLAIEDGKHLVHLDIDCYSDYRRDGRLWLSADGIVARRRQYRDFHIPSAADEFIYYLIKKVLKQSLNLQQLKHLQELACSTPMACRACMVRFWPAETALRLLCAILEPRLEWLHAQLPSLLTELEQTPIKENVHQRVLQRVREAVRIVRRIISPTGFSVVISGGTPGLCSEVADSLVCRLAPAFRRSRRAPSPDQLPGIFGQILEMRKARIRSTLTIRVDGDDSRMLTSKSFRRAGAALVRLLTKRDLLVILQTTGREAERRATNRRHGVLCLDAHTSCEEIVRSVSGTILERLEQRTEKRLHIGRSIPQCVVEQGADSLQIGSAGLD